MSKILWRFFQTSLQNRHIRGASAIHERAREAQGDKILALLPSHGTRASRPPQIRKEITSAGYFQTAWTCTIFPFDCCSKPVWSVCTELVIDTTKTNSRTIAMKNLPCSRSLPSGMLGISSTARKSVCIAKSTAFLDKDSLIVCLR